MFALITNFANLLFASLLVGASVEPADPLLLQHDVGRRSQSRRMEKQLRAEHGDRLERELSVTERTAAST